ncbi:MAG TPA: VWA domain-containing protein [Pyrinomonadaceae bacterium]|nr:VWA domain-containing protein [Pyrinomonadaceae bacterium]
MMKNRQSLQRSGNVRAWVFTVACMLLFVLLGLSSFAQTGQQDGRSRRTGQATARPTPTPARTVQPPILDEAPPPPPAKPTPVPTPDVEGAEIDENATIKIDANLVNLQVRVIDRFNSPVNSVRQEDFKVYEDGVLQPIFQITREEVPISYGLAVDNSGSMRSQIDKVIEAAKDIVNSNKPGDETFLVRFIDSSKIETLQDFTPSKQALMDALDSMFIEGGQTAIVDAVYLSSEHVSKYKKSDFDDRRRRALILVTDGEERNSFYNKEQLFSKLREEDVQIFIIGFVNELDKDNGGLIRKSSREEAVNFINRLAKETGGRAFFPNSLSELPSISNEIIRDLRTQYIISYNPTNKSRDGSFRSIRVAVAEGTGGEKRIALTRSGRIAPKEGAGPAPRQPVTSNTGSSAPPVRNNNTPSKSQPGSTGARNKP